MRKSWTPSCTSLTNVDHSIDIAFISIPVVKEPQRLRTEPQQHAWAPCLPTGSSALCVALGTAQVCLGFPSGPAPRFSRSMCAHARVPPVPGMLLRHHLLGGSPAAHACKPLLQWAEGA